MEASYVPPMALLAFAAAAVAFLGCVGSVIFVSQRLGMKWIGGPAGHLSADDATRVLKILWGLEPTPDAGVRRLVWIVRGLWLAFLGALVVSKLLMKGPV